MSFASRGTIQHASEIALEIDGLTQEGREFGDWNVVAKKKEESTCGK